jgi:hypothetical protein
VYWSHILGSLFGLEIATVEGIRERCWSRRDGLGDESKMGTIRYLVCGYEK